MLIVSERNKQLRIGFTQIAIFSESVVSLWGESINIKKSFNVENAFDKSKQYIFVSFSKQNIKLNIFKFFQIKVFKSLVIIIKFTVRITNIYVVDEVIEKIIAIPELFLY